MNQAQPPHDDARSRPAPDVAGRTLTGLARLATHVGARPVDRVIARLEGPGGSAWLGEALAASPLIVGGDTRRCATGVGLDALIAEKERGKRLMATPDGPGFEKGVLLYLLAVAAARHQHGRVISSQDPKDVSEALADLATALPAPWAVVCMSAESA